MASARGPDIDEWAKILRPNKVTRVEWANTVRQYELTRVSIFYNRHDEAVALAIGKAIKQAGWPDPELAPVEEVRWALASLIANFQRKLRALSKGYLKSSSALRPEVRQYTVGVGNAFIELYIGNFSPQRKVE